MERKEMEAAASRATNLRGLLSMIGGLVFIVIGLGNLEWGPFAHEWAFVVVVIVLVMCFGYVNRYYDARYGRVALLPSLKLRDLAINILLIVGFGLILGMLLDTAFDVPISLFAICFALAMLGWYALVVGLKPHHYVIWGALIAVGLIPMWGSFDGRTSMAWLPIGAATLACGLMDHLTLARSYAMNDDND